MRCTPRVWGVVCDGEEMRMISVDRWTSNRFLTERVKYIHAVFLGIF